MSYTAAMRWEMGGAPGTFESFVFLLLAPDLRVGDAAAQLDKLNIMALIEPRVAGTRWQH